MLLANIVASTPVFIAQLIALVIGLLSFVGSVFLAIGVETHKFLKTDTGKKLIEVDKTVKKVTDYMDKVAKAAAAQGQLGAATPPATAKQGGESMRLFNIVKNDNNNGGNGNEPN